jgi:hypothetical protein
LIETAGQLPSVMVLTIIGMGMGIGIGIDIGYKSNLLIVEESINTD